MVPLLAATVAPVDLELVGVDMADSRAQVACEVKLAFAKLPTKHSRDPFLVLVRHPSPHYASVRPKSPVVREGNQAEVRQ